MFDNFTVNETSSDLPTEEENKDNCLKWGQRARLTRRTEVTTINRDFAKQIMKAESTKCAYPSPFSPGSDVSGGGDCDPQDDPAMIHRMYRYRKYQLSDTQSLLVRTEVHGAQHRNSRNCLFNAYAVNEWCPRTPPANRWRNKLEASVAVEGEREA